MLKNILIVSDTHGDFKSLNKVISKHNDISTVIHLGDGEKDISMLKAFYPNLNIISVKGNCDKNEAIPTVYEGTLENKKIFATHGHLYNVKNNLLYLTSTAAFKNIDILLFGHTHLPVNIFHDNMYIFNPGSLKKPGSSYGILSIDNDNKLFFKLFTL